MPVLADWAVHGPGVCRSRRPPCLLPGDGKPLQPPHARPSTPQRSCSAAQATAGLFDGSAGKPGPQTVPIYGTGRVAAHPAILQNSNRKNCRTRLRHCLLRVIDELERRGCRRSATGPVPRVGAVDRWRQSLVRTRTPLQRSATGRGQTKTRGGGRDLGGPVKSRMPFNKEVNPGWLRNRSARSATWQGYSPR